MKIFCKRFKFKTPWSYSNLTKSTTKTYSKISIKMYFMIKRFELTQKIINYTLLTKKVRKKEFSIKK